MDHNDKENKGHYQEKFVHMVLQEKAHPDDLEDMIPGGKLDRPGAMGVYQKDYFARLTEALGETYEAVWRVVGDEVFFRLCKKYIQENPSTSYNLSHFGKNFSAFLAAGPSLGGPPLNFPPFLEALAGFEWEFQDLFHAPAETGISPQILMEKIMEGGESPLILVRSVLFSWNYPIKDIWLNRDSEVMPEGLNLPGTYRIIMFKNDLKIRLHNLSQEDYFLLEKLKRGVTLARALEELADAFPAIGEKEVMGFFQFLGGAGLVAAVGERS